MPTENKQAPLKPKAPSAETQRIAAQRAAAEAETGRQKKENQGRRNRRRSRQLIGLAVAILVVVGVFSIVQRGFGLVEQLMDNTSEKQEYAHRIEPMVWFDIIAFSEVNQIDRASLLQVSIWGVYVEQNEELERDPVSGSALIPAIEVDRYAANLFGPDFRFGEHTTFTEMTQLMTYEYLPEKQVYMMPVTGLEPPYLPTVMEIKNESGGVKRVTVGYVSARGNMGEPVPTPDYDHPVRFMDFLFQRDGNAYYLFALERSNYVPEGGASAAPSTPAQSLPVLPDDSTPGEDDSGLEDGSFSAPHAFTSGGEGEDDSSEAGSSAGEEGQSEPSSEASSAA